MDWEWVVVLGIVVSAWTVHKVTSMWQMVTFYRYATDEVKKAVWDSTQKGK